jgi:hypothetical protein
VSDITKSLLQAYYDKITTERLTTLNYLVHHEIVQPPLSVRSSWHTALPCVLIQIGNVTLTPACLEGVYKADTKHYQVILSGFVEYYDENYGAMGKSSLNYKGAIDIATDLETIFNRQTFSLSQACLLQNISYSKMSLPQFMGDGDPGNFVHSCELTFDHLWMDLRLS